MAKHKEYRVKISIDGETVVAENLCYDNRGNLRQKLSRTYPPPFQIEIQDSMIDPEDDDEIDPGDAVRYNGLGSSINR